MAKEKIIIILCLIVLLQGCYTYRYEQLTYYKKYRAKGEIRFNGFYFCDDTVASNGVTIRPRSAVFYSDGTFTDAEGDLRISKGLQVFFKHSNFTGPFIIDRDTIRVQLYYNTSDNMMSGTLAVRESVFHIVNDSTVEYLTKATGEKDMYRFVQLDKKPDSSKAWFKSRRKLRKMHND
jgi:hypothetical protein